LLGLDAQMLEDVDMDDEENAPAVRRGGKLGNWAKIGWLAVGRSHRAPGVEFMYVPLSRATTGYLANGEIGTA
jgi:hypothetical protein